MQPNVGRIRHIANTLDFKALLGFFRKGSWALADQSLISATNFLTMVLIARAVSPGQFGAYALAYSSLLLLNTLQSALIIQPHQNLGAPRSGTAYVTYTTDTGWLQLMLGLLCGTVILILAGILTPTNWWFVPLVAAIAPATVAWQYQEFARRAMYVTNNLRGALINDLVSYGGHLSVLYMMSRLATITPVTALLAMALTSGISSLLGIIQIRAQIDWVYSARRIRTTFQENWRFGKWLLAGDMAFWTSGQIYPVFAAALVSATATGVMRAAQTIMGPTTVLIASLNTLLSPQAARSYALGGLPALREFLARIQLLLAVAMSAYCLTVAIFADPIFRIVYGTAYANYSWMLSVVALTTLIASLRGPIRLGLAASHQTHAIFRSYLASSVVNLTIGLLVVYLYGYTGLAVGLALNSLTLQLVMWQNQQRFLGGRFDLVHAFTRNRTESLERSTRDGRTPSWPTTVTERTPR